MPLGSRQGSSFVPNGGRALSALRGMRVRFWHVPAGVNTSALLPALISIVGAFFFLPDESLLDGHQTEPDKGTGAGLGLPSNLRVRRDWLGLDPVEFLRLGVCLGDPRMLP